MASLPKRDAPSHLNVQPPPAELEGVRIICGCCLAVLQDGARVPTFVGTCIHCHARAVQAQRPQPRL